MRLFTLSALLIGFTMVVGPLAAQQPSLVVPLEYQLSTNWCWAASAQMAMEALDPNVDALQRIQAGRAYLPEKPEQPCLSNACSGGITTPSCAFGGFPQFYKFEFEADTTPMNRPLSWTELWQELHCPRPVVFARENLTNGERNGTGHMVAAGSADVVDNGAWIAVKDPAPQCVGSLRAETYQEYLGGSNSFHWIDYYGLHKRRMPLAQCNALGPPPSGGARTGPEPRQLVTGFIAAIQNKDVPSNAWIRVSAGLSEGAALGCDADSGIPQKTISIASLRTATSLNSAIADLGHLRYLCSGGEKSFSVRVEQHATNRWRLASMGDVNITARLVTIRTLHAGIGIEEVFVQGLNVVFARLLGVVAGGKNIIPLSSQPGFGISPEDQTEGEIFTKLQAAALQFRFMGPT